MVGAVLEGRRDRRPAGGRRGEGREGTQPPREEAGEVKVEEVELVKVLLEEETLVTTVKMLLMTEVTGGVRETV